MRSTFAMALLLATASISFVGCADKVTVREEKTISSPEGTTTSTTEREIKQTGSNPPAP